MFRHETSQFNVACAAPPITHVKSTDSQIPVSWTAYGKDTIPVPMAVAHRLIMDCVVVFRVPGAGVIARLDPVGEVDPDETGSM